MNPNHKEIILSKEHELLNAMKNCNIDVLHNLIHKDLIFNIPNGQTTTKTMDIEVYRTGNMEIDMLDASEYLIQCVGDNVTVSLKVRMKGKFMNQPFDGNYRVLRVWKQLNNEWRIIAGSSIEI